MLLTSRRRFLRNLGAAAIAAPALRAPLGWPLQKPSAAPPSREVLAADPLRPQFHLLPARNWMNDPNGPIYWKGQYHMFFQYNPNAAVWGDMHWAHAVSPDMIHWKHLPIALAPTPGGYDSDGCFSGSAVDDSGTAAFLYTGVKSAAPEEATLRDGGHNFREVQCLATSNDPQLLSWTKWKEPVLLPPRDPKLTGFRDPCLWRDAKTWYMGIGSGQKEAGGRVLLYKSSDLRRWEYLHPLATGKWNEKQSGNPVDSGEMWECPDFFALGDKHILLYSTEGKVYWEIGELDSNELVFHRESRGLLDHGAFYAPKSQLDARGNRILWGWIPETRPEAEFSAAGWAGCMSLPRVLTIGQDGRLTMRIAPEAEKLRGKVFSVQQQSPAAQAAALRAVQFPSAALELQVRAHPKPLHLEVTDGKTAFLQLSYDPQKEGAEWTLNGKSAPLPSNGAGEISFHVFLDGSVIEGIANHNIALTARVYHMPAGPLRVGIPEPCCGAFSSFQAWQLHAISPNRLTTSAHLSAQGAIG